MNTENLKSEISKRQTQQQQIRTDLNTYFREMYGIENYFTLFAKHYPIAGSHALSICLARQLPCVNIEHLAIKALCNWLNQHEVPVQYVSLPLTRDSIATSNDYKMSLVKPVTLLRAQNGRLITRHGKVVHRSQRSNLNMKILDSIKTESDQSLMAFHEQKRLDLGASSDYIIDQSAFLQELAEQCLRAGAPIQPKSLYVRQGDYEKRVDRQDLDLDSGLDYRPPAAWYYLPYLALFLDGTMALASTVDKDPEVLNWFQENSSLLEEICGFKPLLINTPLEVEVEGHVSNLNEIPQWVETDTNWLSRLINIAHPLTDLYYITRNYEQNLIALA